MEPQRTLLSVNYSGQTEVTAVVGTPSDVGQSKVNTPSGSFNLATEGYAAG